MCLWGFLYGRNAYLLLSDRCLIIKILLPLLFNISSHTCFPTYASTNIFYYYQLTYFYFFSSPVVFSKNLLLWLFQILTCLYHLVRISLSINVSTKNILLLIHFHFLMLQILICFIRPATAGLALSFSTPSYKYLSPLSSCTIPELFFVIVIANISMLVSSKFSINSSTFSFSPLTSLVAILQVHLLFLLLQLPNHIHSSYY